MKKIRINHHLFILVILAVFVSACGGGAKIDDSWAKQIHTGTDGLVISFVADAPPKEAYAETNIPIGIKVENKGATDVSSGILSLGLEDDYIELDRWDDGGSAKTISFDIDGKSREMPKGEEKMIFAYTNVRPLDPQREMHKVNIYAQVCYNYETEAVSEVCIDTDVYEQRGATKACKKQDVNLADQGAPLALIKIEPRFDKTSDSEMQVSFILHVTNRGRGQLTTRGKALKVCSSSGINKDDLNLVEISASLDGSVLVCNKNTIRLEEGDMTIICRLDDSIQLSTPSYTSLIGLNMSYGYVSSINTELNIKKG